MHSEAQEDGSIPGQTCLAVSALQNIFLSKRESSAQGLGALPSQAESGNLSKRPELAMEVLCPGFQQQKQDRDKKYNLTQAMNKCLCSNVIEIDIIIKAKYSSTNFFPPQIITHCRCQNCSQRTVAAVAQAGQAQPQLPWAG